MKKYTVYLVLIFALIITFIPNTVFAAGTIYDEKPAKSNVSTTKEWVVKFNMPLKADTINANNITVVDSIGKNVGTTVSLKSDGQSISVGYPAAGYAPSNTYYINISQNVKSTTGKSLARIVKMQFTTTNTYENGTSNLGLPLVSSAEFDHLPVVSGESQKLSLTSNNWGLVQYRVFTYRYSTSSYEEITKGYTQPASGSTQYKVDFVKTLGDDVNPMDRKYKLLVYVKRAGTTGTYKDSNTDFDNFYVDYYRCVDSVLKIDTDSSIIKSAYDKTLSQMVDKLTTSSQTDEGNGTWVNPNNNMVEYYLNPSNFLDDYGKYQFLRLDYMEGITAEDLNNVLKGKGILEGKGQVFLDAAKANNISAAYLVSHALLETGNGTSPLSNGILVKQVLGQPVEPKTTYNMFGVKAEDADPIRLGAECAYTQQWFTPEDAIKGGAAWIAGRYINNKDQQNTLYKMRWNPGNTTGLRYATDIGWAYKQIKNIKSIMDQYKNAILKFDIPIFNK